MLRTLKLLIPALIPSWRFFKAIEPSPRIEWVGLSSRQTPPENWQEFRPRPVHISVLAMAARMFWNPRWNETLFLVSCAESLMERPTDHSVREIVNRITAELARTGTRPPFLQFRLVFVDREGAELNRRVTYLSAVHQVFDEALA